MKQKQIVGTEKVRYCSYYSGITQKRFKKYTTSFQSSSLMTLLRKFMCVNYEDTFGVFSEF